jgi:hypothetical protein
MFGSEFLVECSEFNLKFLSGFLNLNWLRLCLVKVLKVEKFNLRLKNYPKFVEENSLVFSINTMAKGLQDIKT